MARYMRTGQPFHGVQKPGRVEVLRAVRGRFLLPDAATYEAAVLALWQQPHREEQYLAIAVARAWREFVVTDRLPLYRRLIVEGAWWDLVDEIAIHLVGATLAADPASVTPVVLAWGGDEDLWVRRSALICQVGRRGAADEELLFRLCRDRAHERDFFIRKAIGWALRDHARRAPGAVRAFLRAHRAELSPLSFREAAKHLTPPP